ncbi:ferroxidase fet3 [Phlyctochytrium bullatum]|nr:ferroxidase fet3 [Phlyctochytrium bullatum]
MAADDSSPNVVEYDWTITNITVNYDGIPRWAIGINNRSAFEVPIELRLGDILKLKVKNGLDVPTSIHFHGLLQRGTPEMDGTSGISSCPIAPRGTFTYRFAVPRTGTFWYHAHHVAQYVDGLRGAFIVRPKRPDPSITEAVLQLADWHHEDAERLMSAYLADPDGVEPMFRSVLANGRGKFDCDAANAAARTVQPRHRAAPLPPNHPDRRSPELVPRAAPFACSPVAPAEIVVPRSKHTLLRIINMSAMAPFAVWFEGRKMAVVEVDGTEVEEYVVEELTVNVGQRIAVLVTGGGIGPGVVVRARALTGPNYTPDTLPGFVEEVTAFLRHPDTPTPQTLPPPPPEPHRATPRFPLNPLALSPLQPLAAPAPILRLLYEFAFVRPTEGSPPRAVNLIRELGREGEAWRAGRNFVNGSFGLAEGTPRPVLWDVARGMKAAGSGVWTMEVKGEAAVVEMVIVNRDPGEHPFHLHGHTFQLLASGTLPSLSALPYLSPNASTPASSIPPTLLVAPSANPVRRDVVTVPACPNDGATCTGASVGVAVIRFVADNPGAWFFHCHIEWHVGAGLGVVLVEGAESIRRKQGFDAFFERTCPKGV